MEASNWRKIRKSWKDKIQYLFTSPMFSDVVLKVSDGNIEKEFQAHSIFLKMASPVFEEMFEGGKHKNENSTIDISENPEVFEKFLRFIYYDDVELKSYEDALDLFIIAQRFSVEPLVDLCISTMFFPLTSSNALTALLIGETYQIDYLMDKARQFIASNTKDVVTNEKFNDADYQSILALLDMPKLNISEFELFESLQGWLNSRPERLKLIDTIVSKFHFFEMSAEEFTKGPSLSSMLKSKQKLAILQNMVTDTAAPLPEGFTKKKRSHHPFLDVTEHLTMTVERFKCNRFYFTVDQKVTIQSIELSTCNCSKKGTNEFSLIIIPTLHSISESVTKVKMNLEKGVKSVRIDLDLPITLSKNEDYWIQINVEHECNYVGAKFEDVSLQGHGVRFYFKDGVRSHFLPLQSISFTKFSV